MSDLFRKEALEKQGQKLFGDVILSSPLSHLSIAALIILIMVCITSFIIMGEYARKERVIGYLTPDSGITRIVPSTSGMISEIYTNIGASVKKGDPLFRIKLDLSADNGQTTAQQLLDQLQKEYHDLQHRLKLIPQEFKLTQNRLQTQIEASHQETNRLEKQIQIQQQSVANQKTILERFENLLKQQAISSLEVSAQENRYLDAALSLENLENNQAKIFDQTKDLQAQLNLLPIQQKKAESEIRSRLATISQKMTQAKGQDSYIIESPIDGRIAAQTAQLGETVNPQKALGSLLPSNSKMQAQLFVPTRAAGFLKTGQTVRLLYDAFPYQKFGSHQGKVIRVSKTIVQPQDLPRALTITEPVFLLRVELDAQEININQDTYPLQAGMTLSADIILENRKIWEWMFEPLLGALQ